MKKKFLALLATSLLVVSCLNQKQEGVVVASPEDFQEKIVSSDVKLIDVRTHSEFSEGHIANATNIDVLQSDFKDKVANLDKEKPVLVYCKKGGRSAKAATILKEMGFKEITDLEGGFISWTKSGKEIEE